MPFDRKLAQQMATMNRDRDTARFFAGREAETRAFKIAVQEAWHSKQAVFRIYQGAPGCGKTSLAAHMAETQNDQALFVPLDHDAIESRVGVMARAVKAAKGQQGAAAKIIMPVVQAMLAKAAHQTLAEAAGSAYDEFKAKRKAIVLHLDEAQVISQAGCRTLITLHTNGLGDGERLPCVVLLTGLGHTKSRITSHPGLSRLASDAVVQMGRLSDGECAESSLRMLDELNPGNAGPQAAGRLAAMTAKWSSGWPKHLHSAQKAICEALIEANGSLPGISPKAAERRCAELRGDYYRSRIELVPTPGGDFKLAQRIVADIQRRDVPPTDLDLAEFCAQVSDRHWNGRVKSDGTETCRALMEQGVVERQPGRWALAIPSMGQWAKGQLRLPRRAPGLPR